METFSALLALCEGNPPVTGRFSLQRLVTRSFDVSFDVRLNKRLGKQSRRQWFETPLRSLWRHYNVGKIVVWPFILFHIYLTCYADNVRFANAPVDHLLETKTNQRILYYYHRCHLPFLLSWINFNPSINELSTNYQTSTVQALTFLGMDTRFHLALYWACDYLSTLRLKLTNVSKSGPTSNQTNAQGGSLLNQFPLCLYFSILFTIIKNISSFQI